MLCTFESFHYLHIFVHERHELGSTITNCMVSEVLAWEDWNQAFLWRTWVEIVDIDLQIWHNRWNDKESGAKKSKLCWGKAKINLDVNITHTRTMRKVDITEFERSGAIPDVASMHSSNDLQSKRIHPLLQSSLLSLWWQSAAQRWHWNTKYIFFFSFLIKYIFFFIFLPNISADWGLLSHYVGLTGCFCIALTCLKIFCLSTRAHIV